ncbi:MAG TPA: redox-regulated ATPase YchF [Candidatus Sulfotelmatobacter sp.]|nr:redox-regulated ATPase YchF [Candidatus Sulfotelmatobacter sp.]
MNLSIGIVGLPNVGKSTLFNALLKKQQAFVANYPFATIEPNVGVVPVPNERLTMLAQISQNEHKMSVLPPIISATVSFVDIAGLVKGAAEGQGLGNKFLSHIREVNAIAQVVRYFKDTNIVRHESSTDAKNDFEVVNAELILADLETLNKQTEPKKNVTKEDLHRWSAVGKLKTELNKGVLAKDVQDLTEEEKIAAKGLQLLTNKPMFTIANVDEEDLGKDLGEDVIAVSAKTESELAELTDEEQKDYLKSLEVESSGLERVIKEGYKILNLISYLTCGEKEVRAWTIKKGSSALIAAGEIHTDFMKKFIKAEVVHYSDFVENNGWKGSREKGKALLEGKDYVMQDGDVVEFKIGS